MKNGFELIMRGIRVNCIGIIYYGQNEHLDLTATSVGIKNHIYVSASSLE